MSNLLDVYRAGLVPNTSRPLLSSLKTVVAAAMAREPVPADPVLSALAANPRDPAMGESAPPSPSAAAVDHSSIGPPIRAVIPAESHTAARAIVASTPAPQLATASGNDTSGAEMPSAAEVALRARQYQAEQARNGNTVSATDAVAHVMRVPIDARPKLGQAAASPQMTQELYADIVRVWSTDASVRQGYSSFITYQSSREIQYCRQHDIGLDDLHDRKVTAADHIADMTSRGCHLTAADRRSIEQFHATWSQSPSLRREFVSFDAYVGFMRSKTRRDPSGSGTP